MQPTSNYVQFFILRARSQNQHAGAMNALVAAGAKITGEDLDHAISSSNVDAVRALIDAGVNIASKLKRNSQLMRLAAYRMPSVTR
jgi:hypothetical protein